MKGRISALGLVLFLPFLYYYTQSTTTISYHLLPVDISKNDELSRLGLTPKDYVTVISEDGELVVKGRFIHLTDIHPDDYYVAGSDIDEMCHGEKSKNGKKASKYGDAVLGCDSPPALMYETIDWIKENLKDKVDFMIWTGDNVRHDNDRNYPRSESQIFAMNNNVSDLLYDTFKSSNTSNPRLMDVELIPSLGNNDVYPHNLFAPGPTLQTRELFQIWKSFVPQNQLNVFNRGAYFFKEVIPGQLAVLSINTLYLFQSNPLVDNCDNKKEPGYLLFNWLGNVLAEMRERNMKVWLSGHVPPNEKNYDISCLRKYIVWVHEYRDVIIGGLYGHMNIDHFIPSDSVAAYKSINEDLGMKFEEESYKIERREDDEEEDSDSDSDDEETVALGTSNYWQVFNSKFDKDFMRVQGGVPKNKVRYMDGLREDLYAGIKRRKKSGKNGERYSIANVGASVIPTFNPGIRVYEYNIKGLGDQKKVVKSWDKFFKELNKGFSVNFEDENVEETNGGKKWLSAIKESVGGQNGFSIIEEKIRGRQEFSDSEESDINEESTESQEANNKDENKFTNTIIKEWIANIKGKFNNIRDKKDLTNILRGKKGFPPKMPGSAKLGPGYVSQLFTPERYVQYYVDLKKANKKDKVEYEIEYKSEEYGMKDLTVGEYLRLGRDLKKNKKKWKLFVKHAFISSGYEEMDLG